jgi:hypothetical protein
MTSAEAFAVRFAQAINAIEDWAAVEHHRSAGLPGYPIEVESGGSRKPHPGPATIRNIQSNHHLVERIIGEGALGLRVLLLTRYPTSGPYERDQVSWASVPSFADLAEKLLMEDGELEDLCSDRECAFIRRVNRAMMAGAK